MKFTEGGFRDWGYALAKEGIPVLSKLTVGLGVKLQIQIMDIK